MALRWLLSLGSFVAASSDAPEVVAPAGRLRGISDGEVHTFRGIPYAEAPVGALRWRPPVPLKPWQGVRDASSYGSFCLQMRQGGSEDCLYLNVFVPMEAQNTSRLPCLVWIHGGGYEFGSSNMYDPTKLTSFLRSQKSPSVLVTFNYRLNVFGFLGSDHLRPLDALHSTGNYGLQDQRMALQWVQDNIMAFGGDPSKVMIFGQSAGAGSVSSHVTMPKSAGLFSRALMESGGFSDWAAQPMHMKELWFQRFMNQTKCVDVDCLINLSSEEILGAYLAIPDGRCCSNLTGNPWVPWSPAIDGVEMTAHPVDLLKQEKVSKVPMVIGTTWDDGATFFDDRSLSLEDFVPLFVEKYKSSPQQAELYLSESHPSWPGYNDGWWSGERAVTDQNFYCTSNFARRNMAKLGLPIFGYVLAHSSSGAPIVQHSDDLPFVFRNLTKHASAEEQQLSADMAMSWYRFAASADPRGPNCPWQQQSEEAAPILKFQVASQGGNQVMDGSYRDRQCAFMMEWFDRNLHPETSGIFV